MALPTPRLSLPGLTPSDLDEARFEMMRHFSYRFSIAAAVIPLLVLAYDLLSNPVWMLRTIPMRLLVLLLILLHPLAMKAGAGRRVLPWILYGALALVMGTIPIAFERFHQDLDRYGWVFLNFLVLGPLMGLPYRLRENLAGLGVLAMAPVVTFLVTGLGVFSPPHYLVMATPMVLTMAYLLYLVSQLTGETYEDRRQIELLAMQDALTGLHNRRYFMQLAETYLKLARRNGREACLLTMDIDRFKAVNDTHGHGVGDQVIRAAGQGLLASLRETDLVARIGGEEFAAFLPDTSVQAGLAAAERVRSHLAALAVPMEPPRESLRFSVSVGLAELRAGDGLDALMERSDRGLYAAKNRGRNRVELGS